MAEEHRDSSANLLAEIEGDWESPKPGAVAPRMPTESELHAELDASAERLLGSLDPSPISALNVEALDSGWGDDDGDDDDDEEEDEVEPELPDERLDPVAYAAAKKARDERVEARRQRRRLKAEAKKARRKARADAQKSKQKGKQRKARPPGTAKAEAKAQAKADARAKARARASSDDDDATADDDDAIEAAGVPSRARAKLPPSKVIGTKPMLSKTNQWMLAVAVIVFLAAAAFAAVVAK
jgi:hypothetical protein